MVGQLKHHFGHQFAEIINWIRGYEESGNIAVDSVAFHTRNSIRDLGAL